MGPNPHIGWNGYCELRFEREWICRWNVQGTIWRIWDRFHSRWISSWYKPCGNLARNQFDNCWIYSPVRYDPDALSLVISSCLRIGRFLLRRRILFGSRCSRLDWNSSQIVNFHCIHRINGQLCVHLHKQRTRIIRRILPHYYINHELYPIFLGLSLLVFWRDWVPNPQKRSRGLWVWRSRKDFTSWLVKKK